MELSKISPAQTGVQALARHADDIRDRLSAAIRIVDQIASVPASRAPFQPVTEHDVRTVLKLRRNRNKIFEGELFADPAWDILLELYAAELGQLRISVSSLCQGAAVPATTALRWINALEKKQLVARRADPMDGRRFFVFLSALGRDAMCRYFRTVPVGAPLI